MGLLINPLTKLLQYKNNEITKHITVRYQRVAIILQHIWILMLEDKRLRS